jgi:hypothetical protein
MTHPLTRSERRRVAKKHPFARDKDRIDHVQKKLAEEREIQLELDEELERVKHFEGKLTQFD